jgi:hypothetical protein
LSLFLNQLNFTNKKPTLEVLKEIKSLLNELKIVEQPLSYEEEYNTFFKGKLIVNFVTSLFLGLDFIKKVINPKLTSWFDVYDFFFDPYNLFLELNKYLPIFQGLEELEGNPEISEKMQPEVLRKISWAKSAEYLSKEYRWYKNHENSCDIPSKNITFDIFDQISYLLQDKQDQNPKYKGIVYTPYYIAKQIAERLIFKWFENIKNDLSGNYAHRELKVLDPAVGTGIFLIATGNVILDNYNHKKSIDSITSIKKSIIESNLYGIDTDEIACYITRVKLLLWLIEEDTNGIYNLPILNTNINTGDSLVGHLKIPEALTSTEINKEILSNEFHSNFQKKLAIYHLPKHKVFLDIIDLINRDFRSFDSHEEFKFFLIEGTMKNWNEYKTTLNDAIRPKIHFSIPDSYLDKKSNLYAVFTTRITDKDFVKENSMILHSFENIYHWCNPRNTSKFNIIIGNPPFIALTDLPMKMRLKLKVLYPDVYTGNNDLSYFFLERMKSLLVNHGTIGFILPKYIQTSVFAKKIRSSLIDGQRILEIHDFADIPIFSSTKVKTCFISLEKQKANNNHEFMYYKYRKNDLKMHFKFKFPQSKLNSEKWVILNSERWELVNHILSSSNHELNDVAIISKGIETGCDKVFAPSTPFFFSKHLKLESADYRSWIKGTEIKQFFIQRNGREVLYAPKSRHHKIEKSQKILQYMNLNKSFLLNRSRISKYYLWRDGDERNTMRWEENKIVCPYKSKVNRFAIDFEGSLSSKDVTWIIPKGEYSEKEYLYILLGLLNSNVLIFYAQSVFKDLGSIYDFYPQQIKKFPLVIPKFKSNEFQKLCELTKRLESIEQSQEKDQIMHELNKMVYQLFNLNGDEINKIESTIMI